MVTTATHDTKRGEDTRLRIAALSELRERWAEDLRRWHVAHRHLVTETDDGPAPDPQTELLLYQTLVGVWPVSVEADPSRLGPLRDRMAAYLEKACREAKERTSWRDPEPDFEAGVTAFLDGLLADPRAVAELASLAAACAEVAVVSGLSQVLLRCTVPGVPDTYQGTETWNLSLVDPDNRRPVDAGERAALLRALSDTTPAALLRDRHDGRIKAWVLSQALRTRRDHAECFGADSTYVPLPTDGRHAAHVVAFARATASGDGGPVVTIAPRLPGAVMEGESSPPLGAAWRDTTAAVPAGRYRDVLSGRELRSDGALPLAEAFAVLPVALLVASA
jgi:(1->4)-alpha-D-glucan 1-alpha-D-glucosylmutase